MGGSRREALLCWRIEMSETFLKQKALRCLQMADRSQDPGVAMRLRHLAWDLYRVADSTETHQFEKACSLAELLILVSALDGAQGELRDLVPADDDG
jgi:hypothetical protein